MDTVFCAFVCDIIDINVLEDSCGLFTHVIQGCFTDNAKYRQNSPEGYW